MAKKRLQKKREAAKAETLSIIAIANFFIIIIFKF